MENTQEKYQGSTLRPARLPRAGKKKKKFQVTCPARQLFSKVNVEPWVLSGTIMNSFRKMFDFKSYLGWSFYVWKVLFFSCSPSIMARLYYIWSSAVTLLQIFVIYFLTLMPLLASLANTKWYKKHGKWLKLWHMGTHMRELSESFPMNTNVTGFRWFSKIFASLCFRWK